MQKIVKRNKWYSCKLFQFPFPMLITERNERIIVEWAFSLKLICFSRFLHIIKQADIIISYGGNLFKLLYEF